MICESPYYTVVKGRLEKVPVRCGRCPACKQNRVNSWVFRLLQEDKVAISSHFITLTYDTDHVPITHNCLMTLQKSDVQAFMKRLRYYESGNTCIKYYAVGEYGSKSMRPHYHVIMFNLQDVNNVQKAWSLDGISIGAIHVGNVSGASIAYTTKYISKNGKIPLFQSDDRQPEFSLMSKGLGKNYITSAIKKYHTDDLSRNYVTKEGGFVTALPRYYRDKILDDDQKFEQRGIIVQSIEDQRVLDERTFYERNPGADYDRYLWDCKVGRYFRFHKNQPSRDGV